MGPTVAVAQEVESLVAADPSLWELPDLESGLTELAVAARRLFAVQMRVLAAFDARGGGQIAGFRSTADWLAKTTGIPAGRAGWLVHTARALRDELPATAAALAQGTIGEGDVRVIRHAQRRLGDRFAAVEAIVAGFASGHTTERETRALVDRLIQQYAPEDHDDDAEVDRERRRLHLSDSTDGWWHLDGLLDPATGAALKAALEVFAEAAGPDDTRSPAQRRCDALGEISERACDEVDRPTGIGHVTLTVTPDQLESGQAVAWPSGLLASKTDVAMHSCGAAVSLVTGIRVDDVHWEPLAVGFAHRYATKAQRVALAARDGNGCVHPGCTVPGWRCIAHHRRHWADGGPTGVENMVLMCRYHHRRVHRGRLTLVQSEEGAWTTATHPPPLPDTG
jgi:hypothetical protein